MHARQKLTPIHAWQRKPTWRHLVFSAAEGMNGQPLLAMRPVARLAHRRLLSTAVTWDYDVVVVGGGVVGAALACELATRPNLSRAKIGLVETRPPPPLAAALDPSRKPDPRVYAMTPASVAFLDSLGVWAPLVEAGRIKPYDAMQIWEVTMHVTSTRT